MAETQPNTMTAADVKKTDVPAGAAPHQAPVLHQTTNPEIAPNIPATGAMGTSGGRAGEVIPGTAAKHVVPTASFGSQGNSGNTERLGVRKAREEANAAQRAKWQEENVSEPVKAVAPQKGKF
jgi:hypothetical protein